MYKNVEEVRDEPIQLIDDSTNLQLLLFNNTDLSEHLKYLEIVREEQHFRNNADLDIRKISHLIRLNAEIINLNKDCSICIEGMKTGSIVTVLMCGHIFHNECIYKWIIESKFCPVCRHDYTEYYK